jgi:signal transduction histidine kinase
VSRDEQKLKEELTALVVHDLRNPLSALRMNLDLLAGELADAPPAVREAVSDCRALAQRALTLVVGLLDVAELEGGLLRTTPVDVAVAEFLPKLWNAHGPEIRLRALTVELEVAPQELRGRFDPDLVGRVVENLLDNAVRYARRRVRVGAARAGADLIVSVGNDGPPIRSDDRGRIFEKFFRIDERRAGARANRGLGLYFCKLVADAHGGAIEVVQTETWPCEFRLRLPQP